ncbi:hypothetical protein OAK45_09965 [Verrucomicrobia bacterium]|nr:hypothetical protein [Verrucomicrobiota bacterium]MDC0219695.1 hypothetical protein [Verrucomicrobiota bacterium]
MKNTKKEFIITFEEDGRRAGGRYKDAAEAIKVNSLFGKVASVKLGSLRGEWRMAA